MKDDLDAALRRAEERLASLEAAVIDRGVFLNGVLVRGLYWKEQRRRAQLALDEELMVRPHLRAPRPPPPASACP